MKEKIATLDDAKTKYQISKEEEDLLGEKINELMILLLQVQGKQV